MLKSVLMKNIIRVKWVGSGYLLFLFSFFLFNLSRWKKETFNYDRTQIN